MTHKLVIELLSVRPKGEHITIKIKPDKGEKVIPEITFGVSLFDMPMLDNTQLPDDHRFAVTLKSADYKKGEAQVKIFEFDPHFITARDRPEFRKLKHLIDLATDPTKPDPDHDHRAHQH